MLRTGLITNNLAQSKYREYHPVFTACSPHRINWLGNIVQHRRRSSWEFQARRPWKATWSSHVYSKKWVNHQIKYSTYPESSQLVIWYALIHVCAQLWCFPSQLKELRECFKLNKFQCFQLKTVDMTHLVRGYLSLYSEYLWNTSLPTKEPYCRSELIDVI